MVPFYKFDNLTYCLQFFFFLLVTFSVLQVTNCQHTAFDTQPCLTLYSEPSAQGVSFSLNNNDHSTNLEDNRRALKTGATGWNVTGSIKIENGCTANVCNETYFDGACHTMPHGSHSVTDDGKSYLSSIASVQCTCREECKCSDIHIKKSTCGRAYLEGGCQTCHALYTNLKNEPAVYFPEEFMEKVKAIRLRKGCSITYYSKEDFVGEEKSIWAETTENFDGVIGSYECSCNDSLYEPRVPPLRPASYPELIDIPDSMDDVVKMLASENYKFHPGLKAARQSYKVEGVQKTHTYYYLAPLVLERAVLEFRIPVAIEELGIANSELRVIDTPGLGDTRGLEQDAAFLATLDNYLSSHEELKDRLPNVVFIFHKFNDNRFVGKSSNFVKMIRGYDIFSKRFADDKYSNVIFVFSHFASTTKAEQKKPNIRLQRFKEVILDYTLYPRPIHICVAKNKADDQEFPMINGYYKLPNNEYYPRNLFEKMELVTQKGGDPIGLGIFRAAFQNTENFNITSKTFHLQERNSPNVEKYLRILTNAHIGVVATQVSQRLQTAWESFLDTELRKRFPMSLEYLQKALNIRNINTMTDVPRTTHDILNLLTALTNDRATLALLDKGLGIKPPAFPVNTIAGHGYNVFKDMPLSTSPFKLDELQPSDIGFMIPTSLSCKLHLGMKEHFHVFEDKEAYLAHRLKSLGIEETIPIDQFTDEVKLGSNIKTLSFRNDSCSLTSTIDFRLFEFVLNNQMDLTPEFEGTVKSLPPFNQSDSNNVDMWTRFFNHYGTHVVHSVHGGGSIQIKLTSKEPFNEKFARKRFALLKFVEDMTYYYDLDDGNLNGTALNDEASQTVTFIGGNPEYHTSDLKRMPITQTNALLANWKKSLKFTPAILSTEMRLLPISLIVKKLGQNYTKEIERATNRLLFQTVPEKSVVPGTTTDTPSATTMKNRRRQESLEREWNQKLIVYQQRRDIEARRREAMRREDEERMELFRKVLKRPEGGRGGSARGCLKEGTRIVMEDMSENTVENLQVGDVILDRYFRPTVVLALTRVFLLDQKFYGFQQNDSFFTANHLFVGHQNGTVDQDVLKLYAKSTSQLYQNNPLMAYLNVTEIKGNESVDIYQIHRESSNELVVSSTSIKGVFEDSHDYPEDTIIYDIMVDSPSGTYFANGYVCRHELPPVENWPNTMSIFFRLMNTSIFQDKLPLVPFTVEKVKMLHDTADDIAGVVKDFMDQTIKERMELEEQSDEEITMITYGDVNVKEYISKMFGNSIISAAGLRLYSRVGPVVAPYLDNTDGEFNLIIKQAAMLQNELYNFINFELEKRLSNVL